MGGADELDSHENKAFVPDPELSCRSFTQVHDPSLHVWAAIVDFQRDIFTRRDIGDLDQGSQRKGPVRAGHRFRVEAFAIGRQSASTLPTVPGGLTDLNGPMSRLMRLEMPFMARARQCRRRTCQSQHYRRRVEFLHDHPCFISPLSTVMLHRTILGVGAFCPEATLNAALQHSAEQGLWFVAIRREHSGRFLRGPGLWSAARPMCFIAFFEVANPAMRPKFMLARIGLTPAQVCDTRASKDGGEGEPQPHP